MLEINSLNKSFGNLSVLRDINLVFTPGEINGIVGRNGAGKTTLFRCIAGLERFKGLVNVQPAEFTSRIGFLEANPYFMTRMTGAEYLRMVSLGSGLLNTDIEQKNVFDLPLKQYASTYSTGMKKKLALTGVLIQQNEIFLLDEPFNGVDIQSNLLISEIILRWKASRKTVIMSSHILGSLSELCDQIHILDQGEIVKSINKKDFDQISAAMQDDRIQEKIDRLDL